MEEVFIREADEQDVPAILALYREAGVESDQPFSVEEAQEHFAVFRRYPYFHIFVAEIDGVIAGTYELMIMDNLAKGGRRSGIVEDVAVSPRSQGRGMGRRMMEHAVEQCRAAGCYKLALSSGLRRTGAHEFYESIGFERHGFSFGIPLE